MKTIVIIGGISVMTGCDFSNNSKNTTKDCSTVTTCTATYASVTMEIQDSAGNPATFNYYTVVNATTSEVVLTVQSGNATYQVPTTSGQTAYVIFNDDMLSRTTTQGQLFTVNVYGAGVTGYQNLLKSASVTIDHDCCHVSRIGGASVIQLD